MSSNLFVALGIAVCFAFITALAGYGLEAAFGWDHEAVQNYFYYFAVGALIYEVVESRRGSR